MRRRTSASPAGFSLSSPRHWGPAVLALLAACGGGDSGSNPPTDIPAAIALVSGDGQSDTVATPLADSLVVRVTNNRQDPVPGQRVQFRAVAGGAGADLIPDTAVTDADGRARARWVLGQLAGPQRVEARVVGNGALVVAFQATGLAGAADTIFAFLGAGQTGGAGAALAESLVVLVADRFGNPVAGQAVSWSVTGGGSLSDSSTTTGADGRSAVRRTLGIIPGAQSATATAPGIGGSPVVFSHTAVPTPTAIVKLAGDSQAARVGSLLPVALRVRIVDAQGNGVAGKSFGWVTTAGNGSSAPRTSVTDSLGEASTQWTLGPDIGTDSLVAFVPGVGEALFTAKVLAGGPDSMAAATLVTQNGTAGLPAPVPPAVRVFDVGQNLVAGASVTFTVTSGGGSVTSDTTTDTTVTVVSDSLGVARLTAWTLGGIAGANTLEASATDSTGAALAGSPIAFTATGNAGAPALLEITTEPVDTVANGAIFPRQPVVRLLDANGNPAAVGGRAVTASLIGVGATLRGTRTVNTSGTGIATFAGLSLLGKTGGYTLLMTAPGLVADTSQPVVITPGVPVRIGLTTQPSPNGASGLPLAQQPVAQVQDSSANAVALAGVDVTATLATGTGTLLGDTVITTVADGSAPFTDLAIAGNTGNRTIAFDAPGYIGVVSSAVQIGAGTPTQLAIITQPAANARSGVVLATQPVVQLRDASGNAVPVAGVGITAAVSVGGTLRGTVTIATNANGNAIFGGLSIAGVVGSYTLDFTSPLLTGVTSTPIALTAGLPALLTVTTQPAAAAQSGLALPQQPAVQVRDSVGNALAQAGITIVASLASGPGGVLRGQVQVLTDAAGVATYSTLNFFGVIGSYTLRFSGVAGSVLVPVNANPTVVSAGPAARLLLTTAPSAAAVNGVAFAQQPVITVADSSSNPVLAAGTTVTAAIATGAPALAGTPTALTNASGVATFTGLRLVGVVGSRTLTFTATGLTSINSPAIVLSAGAAKTIALNGGNNQTAAVGQPVAVPPSVLVTDTTGNPVAGVNVSFTVTLGGGSVGTPVAVTGANGIANAGSWTMGPVAGPDSLEATAAGLAGSPVRFGATATAGAAVRLLVTTQPSGAAINGIALAQQPVVQLLDGNGNPVNTAGRQVTATLLGPGAVLRGTKIVATNGTGTASFTGLDIFGQAGAYAIGMTAPGLIADTTVTILVAPGAASRLVVSLQPSSTVASGVPFAQQPVVRVQDSSGNAVSQGGIGVTASLASGAGTLGGTLTVNTAGNGIATFGDLTLTGAPGARTLAFSAAGLTGIVSNTVQVVAGGATALAVVTQPAATARSGVALATQPGIQLRDASGSNVAQPGVPVTVSVSAGGTLHGITTITTNASGTANFGGLSVSGVVGNYTLTFTSPSLTQATSGTIALSAGLPAAVTITTQPSASAPNGIALAQQPVIQLRDDAGNALSQAGVTVVAAVLSGPGGVLRGTAQVPTNAAGVASFTNLNLFGAAGSYVLKFDGGAGSSLIGANATPVTLTPGIGAKLVLNTAPAGDAQNGVILPQQPVVALVDSSSNPVPQAGVPVTATIGSGAPALSGTLTVNTNGAGVASFTNLRITGVPGTRTLSFLGNGLIGVTSGPVVVSAGPARTIALNGGNNQTAVVGHALPVVPSVLVTDTTGNPVAGVPVSFSVILGGGSVGIPGAVTGANGIANAGGWIMGATAGLDSLEATAVGLAGSPVLFGATATAAATGQLAILTQPSATAPSGAAFGQQPVVQLQDGVGTPLTTDGVIINATVTGGLLVGTVSAATVNGIATFTDLGLGGLAATRTVTFVTGGFTGVTSNPITVTAGAANRLTVITQPSASAASGIAFAEQPQVQVQDLAGNPVPTPATINALILTGGGTLLGTTSASTGGTATASFSNLGISGLAGTRTILFTTSGLASDTSAAVQLGAGNPAQVTAVSATAQNGTVRRPVGAPPAVLVEDAAGNPVDGATVTFAITGGGGTLNGAAQTTGAAGIASVTGWTLGPAVGTNTVTATVTGSGITGNPVSFTAAAGPGAAAELTLSGGNNQSAAVGTAVPTAPSVLVTDAFGNPVPGVAVTFAVTTGGGSITGGAAVSGANGVATLGSWTLGSVAGVNTLTASSAGLTGSPVGFTATATAGAAATITKNGGDNQTRTVGGAVAVRPSVLVEDASGNPVAGVTVTFAVASGGGSLTGGSVVTNASGVATVGSWTIGTTAGSNTLTATAAGLAGSPLTFTATGTAGAANAAASSATVPGGVQGQTTTITIQLRDQFGNAVTVGGANVVASVTGANPGAAVVADLGTGIYLASYLPQNAGTDQISITLNGTPIGGSPYSSVIP